MVAVPTRPETYLPALLALPLLACTARAEEDAEDVPDERPPPVRLASMSAHEPPLEAAPPGWDGLAVAATLLAPVYDAYEGDKDVVGSVQRGTVLAVRRAPTKRSCRDGKQRGRWYEIPGGGFVCSAKDFAVGAKPSDLPYPQRLPDLSKPMPFSFAKVTRTDALRYDAPREDPDLIAEYQTKAYFLAVADRGKRWTRTVYNEWVLNRELRPVVPPTLVGERIDGAGDLPIAFVYGDEAGVPLMCKSAGTMSECGHAEKHSRFPVTDTARSEYVKTPDARFVKRAHVRIAQRIARPKGIPKGAKWVHVDIAEQLFVAYEGDRPVYTSLVSSGADGFTTPNGLHRVYRKYRTKTMRGPDPDAGRYRVEEIPWTMYYHKNYALHGAYWHNSFGKTRSHGCTNIAPADAKWLFDWGTGTVPAGWHANYRVTDGTWFYLTGGADPEPS